MAASFLSGLPEIIRYKTNKKIPDTDNLHISVSRTISTYRGATLIHGNIPCALRNTNISPATDVCPTSQSTGQEYLLLTAPSVVHLADCVPSGSHRPGLSVGARQL